MFARCQTQSAQGTAIITDRERRMAKIVKERPFTNNFRRTGRPSLHGTCSGSGNAGRASLTRVVSTQRCIAASSGPCGNSADSAPPKRQTSATAICSNRTNRVVRRLSSSDPDGLRLRSSDVRRRSRQVRRRDRFPRRHGTLFDGIPLDKISTSMTTNAPATILWSMYLAVAEKQGVAWDKLRGTIQNDILKEYIAEKTYIFPPRPSMKLIVDTFEFGTKACSAMEHHLHQRLSHSRSRIDSSAGTRIHALRRHRICRMGPPRGSGRR